MGVKPSNNYQSDRPESGGADKDMAREKSGLLEAWRVERYGAQLLGFLGNSSERAS